MRAYGRASVSSSNPRAFGICDRCGFLYNHHELQWQYDYRGAALVNVRILVCDSCLDVPQNQLRNIIIPADPTPIMNARIQDFLAAETNYRTTSSQNYRPIAATGNGTTATLTLQVPLIYDPITVGSTIVVAGMQPTNYNGTFIVTASSNDGAYTVSYPCKERAPMRVSGYVATNIDPITGLQNPTDNKRITQNDRTRVTQSTGEPPYGTNQLPGTDNNAVTYRKISFITNNGIGQIRLKVSSTNGMINGQNVYVREVNGVPNANGAFTITIVDNTHVDLNNSVYTGAYLGGGYIINNPSVPLGFDEVPRTGSLPPYSNVTGQSQWINDAGDPVIWINDNGDPVAWLPD